ncbi:hypothetical protein JZO77_25705 [Enterococcus hulanensis]|uniref:hypothetical protein n=1 Tax=Enterococcus hulanensis TaxID=2559929 RepID=UPI00148510B0|nr:hypothetical protein [Enterococcus hulanensis]MBO0460125.1 hypothetical protein [Enterococcus hulanensis]
MEIKIGDYFQGKDCHDELINGTICKILEKTVIVESGVKHYVVKKSELTKDNIL